MGGSLAKDLSAAGSRVLGYDSHEGVAEEALSLGILSACLDGGLEGVGEADLVILATPVDSALEFLGRLAPLLKAGAVVTDVGSTKAAIVAAAEESGVGEVFVGSHPIAGDHRSGFKAARPGLYKGASVYISPTSTSAPAALEKVEGFWGNLGASCSRISPSEHDHLMAWVSHLPQVVSSAVAASLASAGWSQAQLGPGGRDVTRLAGSSPEMWTGISMTNRNSLLTAIDDVRRRLEALEDALAKGDVDAVKAFFVTGNTWTR